MYTNNAKTSSIRTSEKTKDLLLNYKKKFQFSTIDEVIQFLLNEKKYDINEYLALKSKEKTVEEVEKQINNRVESIQKRLSKYANLYFEKIFDVYNFQEAATKEILKTLNEKKNDEEVKPSGNSNLQIEKLKTENRNLLNDSLEDEKIIQQLSDNLTLVKSKFQLKSGAFSKKYEARLSEEEFAELFQ